MRGGRGQKMSVFVHAQGIKTVQGRGGGSKKGKIAKRHSIRITPCLYQNLSQKQEPILKLDKNIHT